MAVRDSVRRSHAVPLTAAGTEHPGAGLRPRGSCRPAHAGALPAHGHAV